MSLQDTFLSELPRQIAVELRYSKVLYTDALNVHIGTLSALLPGQLQTLSEECLDRLGVPLFSDLPGDSQRYLSRHYSEAEIAILKSTFGIRTMDDSGLLERIKQDLAASYSELKSPHTQQDWYTRAASLISAILSRSPVIGK